MHSIGEVLPLTQSKREKLESVLNSSDLIKLEQLFVDCFLDSILDQRLGLGPV